MSFRTHLLEIEGELKADKVENFELLFGFLFVSENVEEQSVTVGII